MFTEALLLSQIKSKVDFIDVNDGGVEECMQASRADSRAKDHSY